MRDEKWDTPYQFVDPAKFLACARASQQCALFVDESGTMIGHYEDEMFWCAIQARHWGHVSHFLTQRPTQLSPTVRSQCTRVYAFRLGVKDAKMLGDEFAAPALVGASELGRLEYVYADTGGRSARGRLDPYT